MFTQKRKPSSFFANLLETLNILIGFFKLDDSAISEEENTKLDSKIADVKTLLTIYGMNTPKLIHEYYLERLREQNEIHKSEDGEMAISLQTDTENLHVEILNAQNLRPMDSNGWFRRPFCFFIYAAAGRKEAEAFIFQLLPPSAPKNHAKKQQFSTVH